MKTFYLLLFIFSVLFISNLASAQVSPPDTILVELTGGDAASNFNLPAKFMATSFTGPYSNFNGSNGKHQTGIPYYSSEVEYGAAFYIINGSISGFPTRTATNFPKPDRKGVSSFIAIKEDGDGNKKIWINISVGAYKIESGFEYNWEYQYRYFEDTKTGEKRATLGTVPNAETYFGQNVDGTVTLFPNDNPQLSIFHQLKGKDGNPISEEMLLEKVNLNKTDLGTLKAMVSADGSKSTIFKLNASEDINSYSFTIVGEGDKEQKGELVSRQVEGDDLKLVFMHPSYFADQKVSFEIRKNNILEHSFVIGVVRPPFLMIHGLLSNSSAFLKMDNKLQSRGIYKPSQTLRMNYRENNTSSFDINYHKVGKEIDDLIKKGLAEKISSGKVDVMGHSMGGILARLYIQKIDHTKVNKIITLNTPHSGSQFGNVALDTKFSYILSVYKLFGGDVGAIEDLCVNSSAVSDLNSNIQRNYSVASHSIVNRFAIDMNEPEPLEGYNDWVSMMLQAAVYQYQALYEPTVNTSSILLNNLLHATFQDFNDLAVADMSQRGNLSISHVTVIDENQKHIGSMESDAVIEKTIILLNANPKSTVFSQSWYDPIPLNVPDFLKKEKEGSGQRIASSTKNNSSLVVVEPEEGAIVRPNQTVKIRFNASEDISNIAIFIGNRDFGISNALIEAPVTEYTYSIPENAIGRVNIVGIGFNSEGFAAMDSSKYFIVEPEATLESIDIYPNKITILKNQEEAILIMGKYADGTERNITSLEEIIYQFDKSIAQNSKPGMIVGNELGKGVLTLTYLGVSLNIPFEVIHGSTSTKQIQTIDFDPLSDKTFGDPAFILNATSSAGLPVSFSIVSGPASLAGNLLTISGEGIVNIIAKQGGNNNYNAAADVEQSFCVVPAQPTITQNDNLLGSSSTTGNQWYFDGTAIEGATADTYVADKPGAYTVQVTGVCGTSLMSGSVDVFITGIDTGLDEGIEVFPVPANNRLHIKFPNGYRWSKVSLFDMNGRVLLSQIPFNNGNQVLLKVDLLSGGVYVVMIETADKKMTRTVIIH